MPDGTPPVLQDLLDDAFSKALKKFSTDVERGEIDPARQQEEFRRRRRDYSSCLRIGQVPGEARALAAHLLQTQGFRLDDVAREAFEIDVARLLIRLYDAFIAKAGPAQGSR
jgi:hypothetical protein